MKNPRTSLKELLQSDNPSVEVELIRLWMLQICLLLSMVVIHFFTDTKILGVMGLFFIASLNIFIAFLPYKTSYNRAFFIYGSLIILTLSFTWYMLGSGGLSNPMASFALGVPGVALYFLGKRHFFIWLSIIIFIYMFMTIDAQFLVLDMLPLPKVAEESKAMEEFLISLLMLCGTSYIFYTMWFIRNKLSHMAMCDQLTGALNRNGIQTFITYEQTKFKRNKSPFSVMILDIDFFKKVNDTYGHNQGDTVIIKVSDIVKECLRESDSTARWGGEEFLVLLPDTNKSLAVEQGEKIRKSIEQFIFDAEEPHDNFNVTVSIGVAEISNKDLDFDKLVGRADNQLYIAKENGRNQVRA